MTRRRRYKPLWADLPPDEPDPYADVSMQWTVEEGEPEQVDSAPQEPPRPRQIGSVAALALAGVVVALAARAGNTFSAETVPSAWGDIAMRCDTMRLKSGAKAVEAFSCRATDGSQLPPGRYESPETQWTSDITREDALTSVIEISGDGELNGVATYALR